MSGVICCASFANVLLSELSAERAADERRSQGAVNVDTRVSTSSKLHERPISPSPMGAQPPKSWNVLVRSCAGTRESWQRWEGSMVASRKKPAGEMKGENKESKGKK